MKIVFKCASKITKPTLMYLEIYGMVWWWYGRHEAKSEEDDNFRVSKSVVLSPVTLA